MSQWRSIIRPAPGSDGPFYVVTETLPNGGSGGVATVTNVTTGVANVGAALDQAKTDGAAILGSQTLDIINIVTTAH